MRNDISALAVIVPAMLLGVTASLEAENYWAAVVFGVLAIALPITREIMKHKYYQRTNGEDID